MRSRWRLLALRLLAFHLRHGPEHPGRWRLLNWAVHWAPHLRGAGSRTVRGREGFRLVVDGRSQTGRMVYVTGSYEPATSALIRRVLRAGDVMVDVGANIGYFSMLAAKCVTPSGHVLAFEPVESVRNELRTNLRINGITTVDVRDEALGARNESLQLFLGPDTDTGLTSLREMPGSSQVSAKVVCFDDLRPSPGQITLVKIDVEGGELDVLRGMRFRLMTDRPHLILEVTDSYLRALNASATELLSFLQGLAYDVFEIEDTGTLQPIRSTEDLLKAPTQFNAYCVPKAAV